MVIIPLKELLRRLTLIKERGFIVTHRAHDTGIGKTLEDLLEIPENNLQTPDAGEIELKAKRLESNSMLTIATKSPLPRGGNKILFEKAKYKDSQGEYSLHSTIYGSRLNAQGLQVCFKDNNLILNNNHGVSVYWPISIFEEILKSKANTILLVFADTKGEKKSPKEEFHYVEAYLLSGLNIKKFQEAIETDKLKIDIRIGVYRSGKFKGRYHDHGTAFRIKKKDFLSIFDNYKQVI